MVQFASYLRRVACKTRLIFPRINGPILTSLYIWSWWVGVGVGWGGVGDLLYNKIKLKMYSSPKVRVSKYHPTPPPPPPAISFVSNLSSPKIAPSTYTGIEISNLASVHVV